MTEGQNHDRRTEPRHDHEIVTTSLEGYMAQVEKEAPKPATPHNPTPAETTAFREFCRKTCHGDCEMCQVAPLYDTPEVERNIKRHVIRLTDEGKKYLEDVARAYLLYYPEQSGDVFDEVMNELDINTNMGDNKMPAIKAEPKEPPAPPVHCDVCGQIILKGEPAHATTSGSIINGQFEMDDSEWVMLVCDICGDQIQYVSGNLETALEAIDK